MITLGVFDGMHRGHQALVSRLQKRSRRSRKNPARVLVTYHPHPDLVLGKRRTSNRMELFTYEEKLSLLQRYDLDAAVFLPFTLELARMTALKYLKEILIGKLKAGNIIIGYDQCFGRGRKGNYEFLKKMSYRYDYDVERISAVKHGGQIVSTSYIRKLLGKGEMKKANRLLGHEFYVTGTVVRGLQRGGKLGFPTANLEIPETKLLPGVGVYRGIVERGGQYYRAMVNIGVKPTFGQETQTMEAHILDLDANLYGEGLKLFFIDRLRDEIKFSSADDLVRQLKVDRERTAKLKIKLSY